MVYYEIFTIWFDPDFCNFFHNSNKYLLIGSIYGRQAPLEPDSDWTY